MKRILQRAALVAVVTLAALAVGLFLILRVPTPNRPLLPFSADKECAIAITDDTDFFQYFTTQPVYDVLDSLGVRLTKTIWVFDHEKNDPAKAGISLRDPHYRAWVLRARERGHEITMHSASSGDDTRERTLAAFDTIRALTGDYPRLEIFHSGNREALYWGGKRIPNRFLRALYDLKMKQRFEGDEPSSPLYWLDMARARVRYLRTFTFNELDTWAVNPSMPYLDPATPDAPLWFASSNARWGEKFAQLFQSQKVQRLKQSHGVSVIYTHFGLWFTERSPGGAHRLRADVREAMTRIGSDRAIEFVPAGELLDRLRWQQWIAAGLAAGERTIRLPQDAEGKLAQLSVEPERLPRSWKLPEAARRPGRRSLSDWARDAGVRFEFGDRDYLDAPVRISGWERWRLTWTWLVTQLISPT